MTGSRLARATATPLVRLVRRSGHINWALADQGVVSGANVLTGILLARFLGVDGFGSYALAWAVLLLVASIHLPSIVGSMNSIGPKQSAEAAPGYYGAVIVQNLVVASAGAAVVTIAIAGAGRLVPAWGLMPLALPLGAATFATVWQDFFRRYFFTRGRPAMAFAVDAARYGSQIAALVALHLAFPAALDAAAALWIVAVAAAAPALASLGFLGAVDFRAQVMRAVAARHFHTSKWMVLSEPLEWASEYVFTFATGTFLGAAAVGALRATQNVAAMAGILFLSLLNVVPAGAARRLHERDMAAMNAYLRRVAVVGGVATAALCLVVAAAPALWLNILFGAAFTPYAELVRWWALYYAVNFFALPLRAAFRAMELTRPIFTARLLGACFALLAAAVLVPRFGLPGALAGLVATKAVATLWLWRLYRHHGPIGEKADVDLNDKLRIALPAAGHRSELVEGTEGTERNLGRDRLADAPGSTRAVPLLPADVPAVILSGNLGTPTGKWSINEAALALTRSLGRRGVRVYRFHPDRSLADLASRYCTHVVCPNLYDDPQGLLTSLGAFSTRSGTRPVLFPASDGAAQFIADHEDRLRDCFVLTSPGADCIARTQNKRALIETARSLGVPVPATHFPSDAAELPAIAGRLAYPAIVKPLYSPDWKRADVVAAFGRIKALKVHGPEQLIEQCGALLSLKSAIMIQEIVPGPDENLITFLGYFGEDGRVRAGAVRRKLRQYPPEFGYCCATESVDDPEVFDLATRLFRSLGYSGIGCVEFKRDPRDGRPKLIEINTRAVRTSMLAIAAGVDFPVVAYLDRLRPGSVAPVLGGRVPVRWVHLRDEIWAASRLIARRELSFVAWVKGYVGKPLVLAEFSRDDMRPGLLFWSQTPLKLLRRLVRRRSTSGRGPAAVAVERAAR